MCTDHVNSTLTLSTRVYTISIILFLFFLIFAVLYSASPIPVKLQSFWWNTVMSPLSLQRDLFITLDLNDFFSSTNAELCLSPMKIDCFPQPGFQGLNLFVVFHQHFCSSQYKVLLTMWTVWWWCKLWVLWVYEEKTCLLPLISMKFSVF